MIQKIPMRDTKAHRANTIQSYSVNVTFGYTFVHSKRASYSSQQDVLPGHRTFAHSGSLHAADLDYIKKVVALKAKALIYAMPEIKTSSSEMSTGINSEVSSNT
jgi:hypothetical protein